MGSLSGKLRNLPWFLEHCFFMLNDISQNLYQQWCGLFALKEAAYHLNWLFLRSDGQSCEATFFNVDKEFFDPSIYHTFRSPCFVLDSRLQSGIGGLPKWEPRSCLGIYVGHSPSHAGSVALFSIHKLATFLHSIMGYLMISLQWFHSWRKTKCLLIGLS